jgi:hypothetical protein
MMVLSLRSDRDDANYVSTFQRAKKNAKNRCGMSAGQMISGCFYVNNHTRIFRAGEVKEPRIVNKAIALLVSQSPPETRE